jgi:membrane associated rhomboid family serine protease
MRRLGPIGLVLIGIVLLIIGFAVPFLVVIQVIQPSFLLLFMSYFASIGGLILGVVGSALYVRERQN